jgi:hypothetical protein
VLRLMSMRLLRSRSGGVLCPMDERLSSILAQVASNSVRYRVNVGFESLVSTSMSMSMMCSRLMLRLLMLARCSVIYSMVVLVSMTMAVFY